MNRRLLFLVAVALVLGGILMLDLGRSPPPGESENPAPAAEQSQPSTGQEPAAPVKLNPLEDLDAGSFTALLERPLFNPGRAARPPEPPPAAPPPPVEQPPPAMPAEPQGPGAQDFVLVAVSAGPKGRVAVVRITATGEVLYLREGQPVQTWSVMSVKDRSVVIGTAGSNVEFVLFDNENGDAAPPMDQSPPPGAYIELPQPGAYIEPPPPGAYAPPPPPSVNVEPPPPGAYVEPPPEIDHNSMEGGHSEPQDMQQ